MTTTPPETAPAWTYTGDPANSPRDEVRFLSGDTNPAHPVVPDAVVDYLLGKHSLYEAAARVADAVATYYAGKPDRSIGPLRISYRDQSASAAARAAELRQNAAQGSGAGMVGPVINGTGSTVLGSGPGYDRHPLNGW